MKRRRTVQPRDADKVGELPKYYREMPLDAAAREAIELFSLLLSRCNYARSAASLHFERCLDALPRQIGLKTVTKTESADDYYVPAEVLTQWHLLPQYVQENGQPRALRANGAGLTVASIVRRVSRSANPVRILEYLLSIRAVERVGSRYIPRDRIARHRRSPRLQRIHNFLATLALLRTVERNARQPGSGRWYQFTTDGHVPESQLKQFAREMREASDHTLFIADEAQLRRRLLRQGGERNLPVTLGIFMSEGRRLPSLVRGAKGQQLKTKARSQKQR
jgi:hypothetical protein